jgi:hypothetical protein
LRGEGADRIRGGGVGSEKESLATAAAKIQRATVAGFAGFLHPCFTAEFLKRVGYFPDFSQAAVLYVFK